MGARLKENGRLPATLLESPIDLALHVALGHVLALVVQLLTSAKAKQKLDTAILVEIQLQGHERHPARAQFTVEIVDLLAVKQQLATAIGITVENRSVGIRMNVHVMKPALAVADKGEGVRDLTGAFTQAAYLGTGKLDPTLEGLVNKVLMMSRTVLGLSLIHISEPTRRS